MEWEGFIWIIPHKPQQPLQGIELEEKEEEKNDKLMNIGNLIRKRCIFSPPIKNLKTYDWKGSRKQRTINKQMILLIHPREILRHSPFELYIETSYLIFNANQVTGFNRKWNTGLK